MLNIQTEKQYREIVEKYSDMIYRIAYQRVLNQYDAEDIVQEVFVKLLCNKNYFRDGEHVKAWLIRVTVNLCVNYKKKLARQKTISASQLEIPFTEPKEKSSRNFICCRMKIGLFCIYIIMKSTK